MSAGDKYGVYRRRRVYPDAALEAATLEHARTAPHPFLVVLHYYGTVAWGARKYYYRLLKNKLKKYGMGWPQKWRKFENERGWCRIPEAQKSHWLSQVPVLSKRRYPLNPLIEAHRQAIMPPHWGTCSMIENNP